MYFLNRMVLNVSLPFLLVGWPFFSNAQITGFHLDSIPTIIACEFPSSISLVLTAESDCANNLLDLDIHWGDGTSTSNGWFSTVSYNPGPPCHWLRATLPILKAFQFPGEYENFAYVMDHYTGDTLDTLVFYVEATTECSKIEGSIHKEEILNCLIDSSESMISQITLVVFDSNETPIGLAVSDSNGHYKTHVPYNLNNLKIGFNTSYFNSTLSNCPSSGFFEFNSDSVHQFDFGLPCVGFTDYKVGIRSTRVGAPGDYSVLTFVAGGHSCEQDSLDWMIVLDTNTSYVATVIGDPPIKISGDTLWYRFFEPGFVPGGMSGIRKVKVYTDTNATILSLAKYYARVESAQSEISYHNNSTNFSIKIGGPHDPNNKLVTPQGKGPTGEIPPGT